MDGIDKSWLVSRETHVRSWVKSIVWRLVGFVILGIIIYMVTGNWKESLSTSSIFNVIRFVLYYFYERTWLKIQWGIKPFPFRK